MELDKDFRLTNHIELSLANERFSNLALFSYFGTRYGTVLIEPQHFFFVLAIF